MTPNLRLSSSAYCLETISCSPFSRVSLSFLLISAFSERIYLSWTIHAFPVLKNPQLHRRSSISYSFSFVSKQSSLVYTSDDCFETKLKLYEIEERLCSCGFFRAGKACIVQLKYIRSLKAEVNRKLRLTLENGEQLIVSRQYADELKHRLGVK